jgi:hypothetical protein
VAIKKVHLSFLVIENDYIVSTKPSLTENSDSISKGRHRCQVEHFARILEGTPTPFQQGPAKPNECNCKRRNHEKKKE